MPRSSVVVVTLVVIGAVAGLAYSFAMRTDSARSGEQTMSAAAEKPESRAPVSGDRDAPATPVPAAPSSSQDSTSASVAQWIADTQSADAKARAAAIAALADAPKSQAIPALKRVLEVGDAQVDRQIALQSLHKLALQDGDADNSIRDVIRYAQYHGDDDGVTQSAQAVLEDIEAEFAQRVQSFD